MTDPRLLLDEISRELVEDIFYEHGVEFFPSDIELYDDGAEVSSDGGEVAAYIFVDHENKKVTVSVDYGDEEFYYVRR